MSTSFTAGAGKYGKNVGVCVFQFLLLFFFALLLPAVVVNLPCEMGTNYADERQLETRAHSQLLSDRALLPLVVVVLMVLFSLPPTKNVKYSFKL